MSNEEQLDQVEMSIEYAQKSINKMKALQRLTDNKDFITIIQEGYFKEEASRVILTKADPGMQNETEQQQLNNAITAIGYLRQYFITTNQLGRMSTKAIEDDKLTREELLAAGNE